VALTLAQLLTPDEMLHRLLTQRERHVLKLDAFGHVSHGELVNHLFVDILSIAPIRADVNGRWTAAQLAEVGTDVLTFSYLYQHLLTIRIRITHNTMPCPLASLAPPTNRVGRGIIQHNTGQKKRAKANEVSRASGNN